ncbi:hypothetical protein G7Z17_g234 [Cylindrodendrum hubeiense]|uniref:Uncharacterized protein n=1 Tax=Cylindrodendrum hubeiense TaxID=595255 RepID=A0A9P5LL77_9HYPO|nr:hypothetical protein G7Z17_g234 [Cylindrodendrum hubeiense]
MHSTSSKALVLGNFFGTVSPPSKNNLSKGPHSKPSSSKSSSSEKDPYHQENKAVWKAVKNKNGSPEVIIFAVVASDHKSKMKDFVKEKGRKEELRSTVIVTTQNHLQEKINSNLNKKYATLYLLVSSNVERITYEIPGVVKDVQVALCTPPGRPDKLRIDSSSTYCGIKTYAWTQRADSTRKSGHQILHSEGCYFNFSDDMDEAVQLFQPITGSDMSAERLSEQFG